jgi:hypothetical protein
MGQLVDVFLELEKYPLPTNGSLDLSHDEPKVSGFAQPPLFSSSEQTLDHFEPLDASLHTIIYRSRTK